jgi:hypothetical protein
VHCPWPESLTAFERHVAEKLYQGQHTITIASKWPGGAPHSRVQQAIKSIYRKAGITFLAGRKELAICMWRAQEIGKAIGRSERLSGELDARREQEAQLPPRRLGKRPRHLTQT